MNNKEIKYIINPITGKEIKDLTGMIFGRWIVLKFDEQRFKNTYVKGKSTRIYWICECQCDDKNIKSIQQNSLLNGDSTSCGCFSKEIQHNKLEDLIGQKFNRLTVISLDRNRMDNDIKNNKQQRTYWWCQCDCGNTKLISIDGQSLKYGKTTSCGCYKKEHSRLFKFQDLTGQQFGRLTIIKEDVERNKMSKSTYWLCSCNCGNPNLISVLAPSLKGNLTESCGCIHSEIMNNRYKHNMIGKTFGKLTVIGLDEEKTNERILSGKIKRNYWLCDCECGEKTSVMTADLNKGHTISCGCIKSKGEYYTKIFLNENEIEYISQQKYDDLLGVSDGQLSYDFYLPKYNLLIECQGEQHEKPMRYKSENYDAKEQFKIQQIHDKLKKEYAQFHNINLLEIWYWDYKQNKIEDILKKELGI